MDEVKCKVQFMGVVDPHTHDNCIQAAAKLFDLEMHQGRHWHWLAYIKEKPLERWPPAVEWEALDVRRDI